MTVPGRMATLTMANGFIHDWFSYPIRFMNKNPADIAILLIYFNALRQTDDKHLPDGFGNKIIAPQEALFTINNLKRAPKHSESPDIFAIIARLTSKKGSSLAAAFFVFFYG
ncbi:hypothetical protein AVEN_269748-1 [Araneus ventricosus]|uniref:Uncharacterized protein n=1 Tax=Araneus ventricosus TaxID=182803 RepID=A0A4Y2EIU2_ARAVE|nr:hypothetical protein AVEN_269748-1 [Araneus ventricosus]